jgi:cell division protein ZapA (FtsZ GTPase activity inhibitor)
MISFIKFFSKIGCGKKDNNECYNQDLLKSILENQKIQTERLTIIMSALNNLQDALARLSHATDTAVTVLNTPHPTEEALQAAADLVNAQAARLEAASDNDPNTTAN